VFLLDRTTAVAADQRKSIKNSLQIVPPLSQHIPGAQSEWLAALRLIDTDKFPNSLPDDRSYAFPPPYIFYDRIKDTVNTKMLYRWTQLCAMLIYVPHTVDQL
jgi:hypothetical protein